MRNAVLTHRRVAVGAQPQIRARPRGADQRETRLPVLGVVTPGVGIVEFAFDHLNGARQVPSLLAGGGKIQALAAGGVENVLLGAAAHRSSGAVGQLEEDLEVAQGL